MTRFGYLLLHDTRQYLSDRREELVKVAESLGHTDIRMTSRYSYRMRERKRQALESSYPSRHVNVTPESIPTARTCLRRDAPARIISASQRSHSQSEPARQHIRNVSAHRSLTVSIRTRYRTQPGPGWHRSPLRCLCISDRRRRR